MNLTSYGIQTDESDLRAHVCPVAGCVYVFPTKNGLEAIKSGRYPKVNGHQKINGKKTVTATGYLVPPTEIKHCTPIKVPPSLIQRLKFSKDDSTSEKGRKATLLVNQLIRYGWFSLPANGKECEDADSQIKGFDVTVHGTWQIQVKCDFDGGDSMFGGTGNLYLQVEESNPLGAI